MLTVAVLSHSGGDPGADACSIRYLGRCLSSIAACDLRRSVNEVRVILNHPSEALLKEAVDHLADIRKQVPVTLITTDQKFKYPAMRAALYRVELRPDTSGIMWFDDDSVVLHHPENLFNWAKVMLIGAVDVIGQPWRMSVSLRRLNWFRRQPWAAGWKAGAEIKFPQGGFWCAKLEWLKKHDWPTRQLRHRGGDVATGVLISASSSCWLFLPTKNELSEHRVCINCGDTFRDSESPRRSFDEPPLGEWQPDEDMIREMHDFEIRVVSV